jgi:siderophore synthetase component
MNDQIAAQKLALTNLLNCWGRDVDAGTLAGNRLEWRLPATGVTIEAQVAHHSVTGLHRYSGPVRLRFGDVSIDADPVFLGAVLAKELATRSGEDVPAIGEFLVELANTMANLTMFVRAPDPDADTAPFLVSEQSLLVGNPGHPTPKTRIGFSEDDIHAYSPELRCSFPLQWFLASPDVVEHDSAVEVAAPELLRKFAQVDEDGAFIPVHPWQAGRLLAQPKIQHMLRDGSLRWLGERGPAWHPTSSVRTVYRPDAPFMLKLSLGVRLTNSVRNNLRKELVRGTEAHRLLEAGLRAELTGQYPAFDVITDPAWVGVRDLPELNTAIRHNPYTAPERVDARVVASLCDVDSTGLPKIQDVVDGSDAADWWAQYLEVVAAPLLWLNATWGIALEAHQQNTIVHLDEGGWPVAARYRDNQGWYFKAGFADRLQAVLPGAGVESDTIVDDEVVDERFGYYLGVNHLFGVLASLGAGKTGERQLLEVLRSFLEDQPEVVRRSAMVQQLLDSPTLRCKSNLLTRVAGLDELVGPVSTQSVYVSIPNPLVKSS